MPRPLRHTPPGGLVEVTCRTIQGRFLLRPSVTMNALFLGVLGRALLRHDVELVAVVCMSSHFHLLVVPRDAGALADFMEYFVGQLSKKVNRLTGWGGTVFPRRYQSIVVSDEAASMIARLRYILSHGVKEGLVIDPRDWPGVESATALSNGERAIEGGAWFDGTSAYRARLRGESVDAFDFPEPVSVPLAKLPCWAHLDEDEYTRRVKEIVEDIEAEAWKRHGKNGTAPRGAHWVRQQDPQSRPQKLDRSPAPRFHALTRQAWRALEESYRVFESEFYAAVDRLRAAGNPHAFPDGAFPPAQAFVAA